MNKNDNLIKIINKLRGKINKKIKRDQKGDERHVGFGMGESEFTFNLGITIHHIFVCYIEKIIQ